ncbi:cytochrome c oxidase assembly protein (plasmid) [Streptomyces mirabilis]|nr:cytochrome c oxidase assembly protein [Streptomyces mirabilis]QUW85838.1 cytochrome c oxidase assembly protein [Streptomyces mirabilis]
MPLAAGGGQHVLTLPELTGGRFLDTWRPDPAAIVVAVLLGGLYLWGVVRLHRRGERWRFGRTTAFLVIGLGTIVFATMSALAVYSRLLFWPAAVQNVLLDLIAPIGLALGDPLSLALRALPPHLSTRVRRAMTGRVVRLLTYPLVSSLLVVATELGIYFTPYFATALRVGAVHELMYLHLLVSGCLFVLPMLAGEELLPAWCTHPVRAALVFLDGVFDAIPGLVVMTSSTLLAGRWYAAQGRDWGPNVQRDQMIGGGAMISIAELVGLLFLIAMLAEWARNEKATTAALDRRLDAELERVPPPMADTAAETGAGDAEADRVRPWWETDPGIVGQRFRAARRTQDTPPRRP